MVTSIANQEFTVAQNNRRAPSSRTLMGLAHARVANEKFTVTQILGLLLRRAQ